jgi:hypothetical protein
MRFLGIVLLALPVLIGSWPAGAVVYHPWCARYQYRSYATMCLFDTQAQCLADVRGLGGFCMENVAPPPFGVAPAYPGNGKARPAKRHPDASND